MQSVHWQFVGDDPTPTMVASADTVSAAPTDASAPTPSEVVPQRRRWPTAVQTSLVILATIAVIGMLQWAKAYFIPLAVAIFATFWLMPIVDGLQRLRIPRGLGAAVVLIATIVAVGVTGYGLRDDARDFANSLSSAMHHARAAVDQAARDKNGWLHQMRSALSDRETTSVRPAPVATEPVDVQSALLRGSTTVAAVAVDTTVVLFLIYLLLASGDMFKRKLLVVISGHLAKQRVTVEILNDIGRQFQRYLAVLISTNVVIGFLTWGVFSALDVEHAAVWGIAAAVLHLIPYLGPAVIAAAVFLVASVQFNSLGHAFLIASAFLLITAMIGMALTNFLASLVSNMNPVATFAGLMFWAWLWGIPGLLLGTPIMMATKAVADRIECLNWLGTFLTGAPKRARNVEATLVTDMPETAVAGATPSVAAELAAETWSTPSRRFADDLDEAVDDLPMNSAPA